jgi:hypothetical protein
METIKRPNPEETVDDLLAQQHEFNATKTKQEFQPAASCIRPQKKSKNNVETSAKDKPQTAAKSGPTNRKLQAVVASPNYGRFNIALEAVQEESAQVLHHVTERFPGFFDCPHRCAEWDHENVISEYALDEGFPEVMDLSRYFTIPEGKDKAEYEPTEGKSIFATVFDRALGDDKDGDHATKVEDQSRQAVLDDSASVDNDRRIHNMSADEIERFRSEIYERLDAKNIEFLRSRGEQKSVQESEKKESRFKAKQRKKQGTEGSTLLGKNEAPKRTEEAVRNLEVIGDSVLNSEELDPYSRLAMDAVHLDFATKALKSVIPRQEQNILRLFDMLKYPPNDYDDASDALRKSARARVDAIKEIYLEEIRVEENKTVTKFAPGVNPIVDGAWTFVPIRSVVDAVQSRGSVTDDDVDIVRLALLWSLLLFYERPSLFVAFSQPSDIYCRIAEIFLMGPEMFRDDIVAQCVKRLLNEFVFEKGRQGLLTFRLEKPIAALDAFIPFYEDLLRRFEEFSTGDENFSLVVLIAPYMNAAMGDALLMMGCLWAPDKHLVRQMTLSKSAAKPLLDHILEWRKRFIVDVEMQYYQQYSQVLAMYAAAVRDERITPDRNPVPFAIAASELGEFVKRHTAHMDSSNSQERVKEFDVLVEIIRKTVQGKLSF